MGCCQCCDTKEQKFERFCRQFGHPLETCRCFKCQDARWINQELGSPVQKKWPLVLVFKQGPFTAQVSLEGIPFESIQNRVTGFISSGFPSLPNTSIMTLNRSFATPAEAVELVRSFLNGDLVNVILRDEEEKDDDAHSTDNEEEEPCTTRE